MHPRTAIRQAVVALLQGPHAEDLPTPSYATAAEGRVYPSRIDPFKRNELPAIAVYTISEKVSEDSIDTAPRELRRETELVIEGWVMPDDDTPVDDAMDDLALEIEAALHADPYFNDNDEDEPETTASDSILRSTELQVVIEGERQMGRVTLKYAVTYLTLAPVAPELDDFETVNARINLGGEQDEDDETAQTFTVEETP